MENGGLVLGLREQMSQLLSLFALSMIMLDRIDEQDILALASSSVAALAPCRVAGSYLVDDRERLDGAAGPTFPAQLVALAGSDGQVAVPGSTWAWAYPLRGVGGDSGYLVISADAEPSAHQQFLLKTLAQQTGAALSSAALYRRQRANAAELGAANSQLAAVNEQLTSAVTDLERQRRVLEMLTQVAASGAGETGIADTIHELTDVPVAVEDHFGNLRAWAGPDRPERYPRWSPRRRAELLTQAQRAGHPVRHGDRLLALAQPRGDVLGVLVLIDPDRRAGHYELFVLEHGAVVLAMELAHQRGLAETELRLRRDLVEDLLSGTDDESALSRSHALGLDLSQPHQVLVVRWKRAKEDAVERAVGQATTRLLDTGTLLARRTGDVVVITGRPEGRHEPRRWDELHGELARILRSANGAIGVGGLCTAPSTMPRSYAEARRAVRIREGSATPSGVTEFDDLGIYRLLDTGDGNREVSEFVREWLGPLIDYDDANHSELVRTLWRYYECGGNYDATAKELLIHRSTLRYRLRRIRELTGHDLGAVDSRLNLHIAARAWQIMRGSL